MRSLLRAILLIKFIGTIVHMNHLVVNNMEFSLNGNEYKHFQANSFIQTWTVGIPHAKIVSYIIDII